MTQNPQPQNPAKPAAPAPPAHSRRAPARLRHPFETLRQEIERFIHDFDSAWSAPTLENIFTTQWPESAISMVSPAVDIVEKDASFEVRAELPGMQEKDIEVTIAKGIVRIRGEKQDEKDEKKAGYHVHERHFGSFERSFRIPEGVDTAKIDASYKNGLLTVVMPKSPSAQPETKKISIKSG